MTVGINKDRHARIIIECPEITLHPEAGYIFADCSRQTQFFLQFGGGPYIFQLVRRRWDDIEPFPFSSRVGKNPQTTVRKGKPPLAVVSDLAHSLSMEGLRGRADHHPRGPQTH